MLGILCINGEPKEAAQVQSLANSPWPCFHGNAGHTGLSPYDTSQVTGVPKWIYAVDTRINMQGPVIGSDGTIYINSYMDSNYIGRVCALNPDGTLKWSYSPGSSMISTLALSSDGTIYFDSMDGKMHALNPDGTLKWSCQVSNYLISSPVIGADGTIYIGTHDNKLLAIRADGTIKWSYTTGDCIWSSPAIGADGTIYVHSYDQKLYALNPDGTLKWSYLTGGRAEASPTIGPDGAIYVSAYDDGKLYALNSDGTLRWTYQTGYYLISSPAVGADGTVYVGSCDRNVYALNQDGTLKWSYLTNDCVDCSPAIGADGTIYVGSCDNRMLAFNPNGTLKWSYATGDWVLSSPAIGADGTVYVGSCDGKLYAFGNGAADEDQPQIVPGSTDDNGNQNSSSEWPSVDPSVQNWSVDIDPDTVETESNGNWITAYIELPNGADPACINSSSILLNGALTIVGPTEIGDYDLDGIPDLMVKFDRAEFVTLANLSPGQKTIFNVTVSGTLLGGSKFIGSDSVLVMNTTATNTENKNASNSGQPALTDAVASMSAYELALLFSMVCFSALGNLVFIARLRTQKKP